MTISKRSCVISFQFLLLFYNYYYFRNAVKYYQRCLSYQPESFDAWAGLSIAMSQRICEKVDLVIAFEKHKQFAVFAFFVFMFIVA